MSGGTETTTGYFVATDGQAYENFMGRWSHSALTCKVKSVIQL